MCRIFLTSESHEARFRPDLFVQPAIFEYLRRSWRAPGLLLDWLLDVARHPLQQSLTDNLVRLGSLLPTGLFDNEQIEAFLRGVFTRNGRSNDFRALARKLYVIAVELDSGKAVRFGAPGFDDVPISRAIQASSALPGLYPPVRINDRFYVDGALQRTLHASVALDEGADLVIGINPLVPFDATRGGDASASLVERGLPAVLSQRSAPCCNRACRRACRNTAATMRPPTSCCLNRMPTTRACSSRTSSPRQPPASGRACIPLDTGRPARATRRSRTGARPSRTRARRGRARRRKPHTARGHCPAPAPRTAATARLAMR